MGYLRTATLVAVCFAFSGMAYADEASGTSKAKPADRKALEQQFTEKMTGAVFAGTFSVAGKTERQPQSEKYTITKVVKLRDDYWTFFARIQYGGHDVEIPMTLEVKWAGDTPVITLTETTIPQLGTFTARVLVYGDRYAGTWQHNQVGGHLWGQIEKVPQAAADKP